MVISDEFLNVNLIKMCGYIINTINYGKPKFEGDKLMRFKHVNI